MHSQHHHVHRDTDNNNIIYDSPSSPSSPGLRNRRSASNNSDHPSIEMSAEVPVLDDFDESSLMHDNTRETPPQSQQTQPPPPSEPHQQTTNDALVLHNFWRTFDDVVILSLFAIFGIVFRMLSATWFSLELAFVFSEDSALSTNLPLNCLSCFLLGLLCSGRDAMGIVYSKVLGGANPYGSNGRNILDIGKGAYRGVVDAGREGINRARGYKRHDVTSLPTIHTANIGFSNEETSEEVVSDHQSPSDSLHRRRSQHHSLAVLTASSSPRTRIHLPSSVYNNSNKNTTSPTELSPVSDTLARESIAGLLGLDEDYRIGARYNNEDEVREVQLRALTRRIIASPSLMLFPAKKVDVDVMEHYQRSSSTELPVSPNNDTSQFEIGSLDDEEVPNSGQESGEPSGNITPSHQQSTNPRIDTIVSSTQQQTQGSNNTIGEDLDDMLQNISESLATLGRINVGDGWDVGTSAEDMKHDILLGLRCGLCGAISTFSSWNTAMVNLLRAGKIGEALIGYGLGIQLGIISYRFGQHLAVYFFVWRCRRETKRDERRGYGLRIRADTTDSDQSEETETAVDANTRRTALELPSIRAVMTSVFATIMTTLLVAVFLFPKHQQFFISLLFTPFGCLARW
jgi:fluoride ion exporter CrcB/FEX